MPEWLVNKDGDVKERDWTDDDYSVCIDCGKDTALHAGLKSNGKQDLTLSFTCGDCENSYTINYKATGPPEKAT
jgi:hypothetical protein